MHASKQLNGARHRQPASRPTSNFPLIDVQDLQWFRRRRDLYLPKYVTWSNILQVKSPNDELCVVQKLRLAVSEAHKMWIVGRAVTKWRGCSAVFITMLHEYWRCQLTNSQLFAERIFSFHDFSWTPSWSLLPLIGILLVLNQKADLAFSAHELTS